MEIITHTGLRRIPNNIKMRGKSLARKNSQPNHKLNLRIRNIMRDLDTEDIRITYGSGNTPDVLRNMKTGERVEMEPPFYLIAEHDLRRIMSKLAG